MARVIWKGAISFEQVTDVKIEEPETADSETDLTELLRQSLQGTVNRSHRSGTPKKVPPPAARKTASRGRPSKSVH